MSPREVPVIYLYALFIFQKANFEGKRAHLGRCEVSRHSRRSDTTFDHALSAFLSQDAKLLRSFTQSTVYNLSDASRRPVDRPPSIAAPKRRAGSAPPERSHFCPA